MSWIAVVIIAVTVIVYLAMYGLIFMAAEPRLRYWQSQQVKQASFTISNGVPAGGAVGLAVQFGMLASYKIPATSATAAITAVSLWSTFASLGFPILGVLALTVVGAADGVAWMGPVGLGILILVLAVFVSIMRSWRSDSPLDPVVAACRRNMSSRVGRRHRQGRTCAAVHHTETPRTSSPGGIIRRTS